MSRQSSAKGKKGVEDHRDIEVKLDIEEDDGSSGASGGEVAMAAMQDDDDNDD